MKKLINLKEILLMMTLATTTLFIASCENNQKHQDTKVVAEKQNDAKFDNLKQEKEAQFLVNASEINLEQIELGQLAQQKGNSTHVRELGEIMENAHTKSQKDLKALAKSKNVTIPNKLTNDARDAYKNLNEKTGDDFDEAYTNRMISDHNKAISTFEIASKDSNDNDIRNWALASLPEMRKHYDRSIDSKDKFNNMYLMKNK